MRAEHHPLSGMLYEEVDGGRVRVSKDGRHGIFDWRGKWIEGSVTMADVQLCRYIAGANIPEDHQVIREWIQPEGLEDEELAAKARYNGMDPLKAKLTAIGLEPTKVVGKYVGDPGHDTPWGPRSKGWVSKADLHTTDRRPEQLPEVFLTEAPLPGGPMKVSTDRYYEQKFHDLEVEHIWKKAWQFACFEVDLPDVGDHVVYDIAHLSFLVVRVAPDQIKAYYNACLHRGRQLCDFDGKKATEFRCPFHGWTWRIDGSMKHMPCEWDFPDVRDEVSQLPEVQVGTWAGFVFINPDPAAGPLEEFLGEEMMAFYAKLEMHKRHKQVHVAKVIAANWKAAQEAFMEAYHVMATHPQQLLAMNDASNAHYDVFGYFARANTPVNGMSPHRGIYETPDEIANERNAYADNQRDFLRSILGDKIDTFSDEEMVDYSFCNVFPNFHPWGGWARTVYRFRPYGDDPETCVMEIFFLNPWPEDEERPPAAQVRFLELDDPWALAPELGFFARTAEQDVANLASVQRGIRAKKENYVIFSVYAESKIRSFYEHYDRWLGLDQISH
jgi:nitrite reductase/ring-hydroxylating ferredoxin subunit